MCVAFLFSSFLMCVPFEFAIECERHLPNVPVRLTVFVKVSDGSLVRSLPIQFTRAADATDIADMIESFLKDVKAAQCRTNPTAVAVFRLDGHRIQSIYFASDGWQPTVSPRILAPEPKK